MEITFTTPALLFPAISLIMLAYTNRFLALANIVRNLHDRYHARTGEGKVMIHAQIRNLKFRIRLVKNMQILGVLSFLLCIICMYLIYVRYDYWAGIVFGAALILFAASLILSLLELVKSTRSLEIELSDMEGLEDPSIVEYIKDKLSV